ncbi:hypothetical protein TNCT_175861 [Trichonephila clavata]|uniref:Uncharacterized protein n=1 Tax=Trichonephila clavata TaxID=2740835 RepID=A0A8X6JDP3_TRICU|nr:hypothetical protein TNCT_175861 [Trichonephila clavata]
MFRQPPPRMTGRTGHVGPSRVHLNNRSVGAELCLESFHSTVNVISLRNECFANPRHDGRTVMVDHPRHQNTRSLGPELCPESFHRTVNVMSR